MSNSFYIMKPDALAQAAQAEHTTLKEAEKDLQSGQPGSYVVVQIVRTAVVEEVPTRTRVKLAATRTRVPRDPDAPKRPRKPRKAKGIAAAFGLTSEG